MLRHQQQVCVLSGVGTDTPEMGLHCLVPVLQETLALVCTVWLALTKDPNLSRVAWKKSV